MANASENEHAPKRAKATGDLFTMMQVCREADMTYQTLKFYCNQGLVPNVKRDKNNRRVFDKHDVEWVKSLICLKRCGMSIEEMKEYLALCLQGETSIPQRKTMLAEKRSRLVEQIAELEASVEYIDWKQGFYDDVLAGRTEYFSNLLPEKRDSNLLKPTGAFSHYGYCGLDVEIVVTMVRPIFQRSYRSACQISGRELSIWDKRGLYRSQTKALRPRPRSAH